MKLKIVLTALWDRLAAALLALLAGVLLIVGWNRVSDTPFPAEQLPYLMSAGIGALYLLGIGVTLWLSADLRDEWHKLDAIDQRLERLEQDRPTASTPEPAQVPEQDVPNGAKRRADRTRDAARS